MTALPCKEQILAAVEARLTALADAFPGLIVERNRDEVLTDEKVAPGETFYFLGLFEVAEEPHGDEDCFSGERGFTLSFTVEGVTTGADPADAKTQAAVLRAASERALLAGDLLGQKARDIRLMPEPPPPRLELDCEQPTALFVAGFEVDYASLETDLFTFAD